jgi:hypothetical protein
VKPRALFAAAVLAAAVLAVVAGVFLQADDEVAPVSIPEAIPAPKPAPAPIVAPAPSPAPPSPTEDDETVQEAEMERPDPESPPLTDQAATEPVMSEIEPDSSEYDAPTEARQRFRAFEMDAIGDRPLTPAKWRVIQGDHGDDTLQILRRAKELVDAERPEAARELMEEWGRLTSLYRNEAYGRGRVRVDE